jgi:hypothetical protein
LACGRQAREATEHAAGLNWRCGRRDSRDGRRALVAVTGRRTLDIERLATLGVARFLEKSPGPGRPSRFRASAPSLEELRRDRPARLPEIPEIELVRHFTELSTRNFGIDTGFYPLGSCTMKYNPRVNERVAALPGFRDLHPHQDETAQAR